MLFDQFVKTSSEIWNQYFRKVQDEIAGGRTNIGSRSPLFPTMLLCTRTAKYYVAELIGACEQFKGLTVKRHFESSVNTYINLVDTSSSTIGAFRFDEGENTGLIDLVVGNNIDEGIVQKRFPFVDLKGASVLSNIQDDSVGVIFGENNLSTSIIRCLIVNTRLNFVRIKNIEYLIVIHKGFSKSRYLQAIDKSIAGQAGIVGMRACSDEVVKRSIISSQFSSLYLTSRLHEITIGEFLAAHPDILRRALGTKRFLTEPYLKWIEKPSNTTEDAINPDLLIEREDGDWDIYDLKTAALNKPSLTKGKRARRRFIDYVQEGVAQLANYREYFASSINRQYAKEKYGISVTNPNLVLVVGSLENAKPDEIKEASRALSNFAIIDYDSLMQLFIYAGSKHNQ